MNKKQLGTNSFTGWRVAIWGGMLIVMDQIFIFYLGFGREVLYLELFNIVAAFLIGLGLRPRCSFKKATPSEQLSGAAELAAGVAHEIHNPLISLKGFIQLMKTGNYDYRDVMLDEVNRLSGIAEDLSMLAAYRDMNVKESSLIPLLKQSILLHSAEASRHGVRLTPVYEGGAASIVIMCDEGKLMHVFVCLIRRAIESSFQGGDIRIVVKLSGPWVTVTILEQGGGGQQIHTPRRGQSIRLVSKEHPASLGVLVSRNIVEKHRGSLRFYNELGKGPAMEIRLPVQMVNRELA